MSEESPDVSGVFDLCIVGAGISGLNALFVATQYLPRAARVILLDRNSVCGGMWSETYAHVRLHQPHQMFTVGDIAWDWDKPEEYLATGEEVQAHLAHCLAQLRENVQLTEAFGVTFERCEEMKTSRGARNRVFARHMFTGELLEIEALRTIHATGWDIPRPQPLKLTSRNVISTTPHDLARDDVDGTRPAVVVGGGKTGMDTLQALIEATPARKIILINGQGTVFGNRDTLFPKGFRRWWGGTMVGALSRDITTRFNGTNTEAVFEYFHKTYTVSAGGQGARYFFSMMSLEETRQVDNGVSALVYDYLEDVVDGASGPQMVLRSGARQSVAPDSIIINCTGHLLRHERPYTPYASDLGTILTITPRSSVYFLSSSAAYFLTHVFYLGKLRSLPLYELDMNTLFKLNRKLFFLTCLTHSFYNMMLIMQNVPLEVFGRCGLDLNRWFPLPRRLLALMQLKLNQRRCMAHCRRNLDHIGANHGIRCGPLVDDGD